MIESIYGEIIKSNLEHWNMKLKDLALLADVSQKHLSEIINGKTVPSYELTYKIEQAFGIPTNTIFKATIKAKEMELIEKDKDINTIYENIADKEYKLVHELSAKNEISNLLKGGIPNFKNYLNSNSIDFFKYKDKPLAYYWIAKMDKEYGFENSSGSFKKSMGDTIIKNTLDILYQNNSIYERIKELQTYLDKKGIILRNSAFIKNSTINGCVLKKDKQYFIFMNDNSKREYKYIFSLIHELLHIYKNKKDESNEDVVEVIKTYEKKYNKTHKELNLAIKTFESNKKDKWDLLHSQTKKRIEF